MSAPAVLDALWREWVDRHLPAPLPPPQPCHTTRHGLCGMLARLAGLTRIMRET